MSITLDKRTQVSWEDGRKDARYSVTLEYCGHETPRYVLRFCGHWISCHKAETEAWGTGQQRKENLSNKGGMGEWYERHAQ